MLNRRGASLVEMLVAMALAGIVLSAATSSVFTQQRTHTRIASVGKSDEQLRGATSVLATQLAFVDANAGDLTSGQASDTALQFRATVAVALACDRSAGSVTFLPEAAGAAPLGGIASEPRAGDSLWFLGDSGWRGMRVDAVASVSVACPGQGASPGPTLRLTLGNPADTIPPLAPLRVTRLSRYAFYRAGDGSWQLGFREWNDASGSFSAPQPVAGPLLHQSVGRSSRFRYFDVIGAELPGGMADASAVARIRVITHALVPAREAAQDSVRSDSVDVAVQHARPR